MTNSKYRLPAEWEKHEATLLAFPHEKSDWPGKFDAIKWVFVEIIKNIVKYEKVLLIVKSEKQLNEVNELLSVSNVENSKIKYIIRDTDRNWMRDSGPFSIKTKDGFREFLNFGFNGWAKYSNFKKDVDVPKIVSEALNINCIKPKHKESFVVLEGGAIDVNGCGTLIATEECLLDKTIQVRNPYFGKDDYESIFNKYFGVTNTIWLKKGIEGDDTHGHVDDICRFVNKETVLACVEENKKDINHKILSANLKILKQSKLENGKALKVVEIPMPSRIDFDNYRLPASYVNFLITNGSVLVPVFNDVNDYTAIKIFRDLFPQHEVIGIYAKDLVLGLGTLHCLSREITK